MHAKTLVVAATAAFAVLAGVSSFADELHEGDHTLAVAYTSVATRAQVRDERLRARALGRVAEGEKDIFSEPYSATFSRQQVRAETLEAIRLDAISRHQRSTSPTQAQLDSIHMAGLKVLPTTLAAH